MSRSLFGAWALLAWVTVAASHAVAADVEVILDSASGATGLVVKDSAGNEVLRVRSDGSIIGGVGQNLATGAGMGKAIIAGGQNNVIQTGAAPSTIGGGVGNRIETNAANSTIAGGIVNRVGYDCDYSTIAGGRSNAIQRASYYNTIGGGYRNTVQTNTSYSTIGGGERNTIAESADRSTISGGSNNSTTYGADYTAIAGGRLNVFGYSADYSAIGGGYGNTVASNAMYAVIAGGYLNTLSNNASYAAIGGGYGNEIGRRAMNSTIPGGRDCAIADDAVSSLAAGYRAKANHRGSFVWADGQAADFGTTTSNQFLIRAKNGVGINTAPGLATLDVYGTRTVGAHNDGIVNIGTTSGSHITLDNNELHAFNGTNASTLYLNDYGGDVRVGLKGHVYIASQGGGVEVGAGGLDVNGSKITEVADPTADTDAANKGYVDSYQHPMLPIAFATVNAAGAVLSGTPNVSCAWNATDLQYEITIAGESYVYSKYATMVTPLSSTAYRFMAASVNNKLVVKLFNSTGTGMQAIFSFVTFKP